MEANGRMRSTVARRLSTLASFYRYCHVEGLLRRNPAVNVRRPKVDHESHTLGLDRNELGALLLQAGLGAPRDQALVVLLALNGLRISEALNADIEDLGVDRGHRTLRIVRKGGKHVTIPIAPRTATAIDLYVGDRAGGPIFIGATGQRLSRHAADRTVKRLTRRAGISKRISPHSLRHSFITAALDAGCRCAMSRKLTPLTSSPRSSPVPPVKDDELVGRYRAPASPDRAGSRTARLAVSAGILCRCSRCAAMGATSTADASGVARRLVAGGGCFVLTPGRLDVVGDVERQLVQRLE
jgi:hypothetical protein